MSNNSIWPIDGTLSGTTTLGQSGPGSDRNEVVLCIPQSSNIIGASSSDCLMSYPGHLYGGVLPPCRDTLGCWKTHLRFLKVFFIIFIISARYLLVWAMLVEGLHFFKPEITSHIIFFFLIINTVSQIYLNQHSKGMKKKRSFKSQWVKVIICNGWSQDIK